MSMRWIAWLVAVAALWAMNPARDAIAAGGSDEPDRIEAGARIDADLGWRQAGSPVESDLGEVGSAVLSLECALPEPSCLDGAVRKVAAAPRGADRRYPPWAARAPPRASC